MNTPTGALAADAKEALPGTQYGLHAQTAPHTFAVPICRLPFDDIAHNRLRRVFAHQPSPVAITGAEPQTQPEQNLS